MALFEHNSPTEYLPGNITIRRTQLGSGHCCIMVEERRRTLGAGDHLSTKLTLSSKGAVLMTLETPYESLIPSMIEYMKSMTPNLQLQPN